MFKIDGPEAKTTRKQFKELNSHKINLYFILKAVSTYSFMSS